MDALDDQRFRVVAVAGPARTGKSLAGENHIFKRLMNGPHVDIIVYLPGKTDIDSYAHKEFSDFFSRELHPEIWLKLSKVSKDNSLTLKKVMGRTIQLFAANPGNLRQRQAPLIIATEIDGYRTSVRSAFRQLAEVRGRAFGSQFKLYVESHPDAGAASGITKIWLESNRGLWFWPCPMRGCGDWSSPHSLAPKGAFMRLDYERLADVEDNQLLDHVEKTTHLLCPHCGSLIPDDAKFEMNLAGRWVFDGELIAPNGVVTGIPSENEKAGFWIHGTMSPFVTVGKLAREYVTALMFFERTRNPVPLREVTTKQIGENYEGTGSGSRVLKVETLKDRHKADSKALSFQAGTIPAGVMYLTAAIDMGRHKADVKVKGWDLETRSWVIERFTIVADANGRQLDFYNRQDDWLALRDHVLRRVVPFADDPTKGLVLAGVAIDNSDGNVTHKAREFARRMILSGDSGPHGYRIRLVKGQSSKTAPEVGEGRIISRDDEGKTIDPHVVEFTFNADKLKAIVVERLLIDEDGPGYVRWATGISADEFAELCNEVQIDGVWERRGPNESLDLEVQNEVVRIKLGPDRKEINWTLRPIWARPVAIEPEADAPKARLKPKTKSIFERFDALNRTDEETGDRR